MLLNWWKEVGVEEYVKRDRDKNKVVNSKEQALKNRVYKRACSAPTIVMEKNDELAKVVNEQKKSKQLFQANPNATIDDEVLVSHNLSCQHRSIASPSRINPMGINQNYMKN